MLSVLCPQSMGATGDALLPEPESSVVQKVAGAFMLNYVEGCTAGRIIAFHQSSGLDATFALVDHPDQNNHTAVKRLIAAGVEVAHQPTFPESWSSCMCRLLRLWEACACLQVHERQDPAGDSGEHVLHRPCGQLHHLVVRLQI